MHRIIKNFFSFFPNRVDETSRGEENKKKDLQRISCLQKEVEKRDIIVAVL